jgi:hypothetical protein
MNFYNKINSNTTILPWTYNKLVNTIATWSTKLVLRVILFPLVSLYNTYCSFYIYANYIIVA